MRALLYSTVAALIAFSPAKAAEVSEAGAREITEKLTYYLPQNIRDMGVVKVTPGTQRYALTIDLDPVFRRFDAKNLTLNGLRPFVHYLTPQADGLWKIEANDNLNLSGSTTSEGEKTDFTYAVDRYSLDSLFDPALTFPRTINVDVQKMNFSTVASDATVGVTIDSYTSDMRADNVSNGVADLVANMSAKGFTETINDKVAGDVVITASTMDGVWTADRVGLTAFRDFVVFVLDLAKSEAATLTAEQDARFKELIRANIPFVERLAEDMTFRDVKFGWQGMEMKVAEVGYKFDFNGLRADTRVGMQFSFTDPVVPAGLLPPGTEAALPKMASAGVAVSNLDIEGVLNYVVQNADFTKADPLSEAQKDELGRIVLRGGRINVEFYNVAARSDVYDVTMTGRMTVDPDESSKADADVTIVARDIDKTVKYLQDNAGSVPEFGQASFMLLMMKGFGKAEADGSMVWNVKVDEAGKVTINGQEMKI